MVLDPDGNVAEFSHANLVFVKDGVVITPKPNETFLDGITRNRVSELLGRDGVQMLERTVIADLEDADEIWMCGNAGQLQAVTGFEDRSLQPGPIYRRGQDLYQSWLQTQRVHGATNGATQAELLEATG